MSAPNFSIRWLIAIIGAVATLSILTGMAANDRDWSRYVRLMQDGSNCQATITIVSTETGGDRPAQYSFRIAGREYSGTAAHCTARVGEQVTITYLAEDPTNSCLGSPGARLADEVVSWFFGGLSFPSLS